MKKYILQFAVLALVVAFTSSCKKFLEIDKPIDQLTTDAVFSDSTSTEATVNGFYSQVTQSYIGFLYGRITLHAALASDEIYQATSSNNQFEQNSIQSNNGDNLSGWNEAYNYIYQANAIIERLAKSKAISISMQQHLTGEMKTMRALVYFYLVNLYGPIPLTTTSDYRVNAKLKRSDILTVYAQILADLKDSQTLLANVNQPNVRASKWAATALLSRVYLFQKDWKNAQLQADIVINSGKFSLSALAETFSATSAETILQIMPSVVLPYNSAEGYLFIPYSSTDIPTYALRDGLVNTFESGDRRKSEWLSSNISGGQTYYYPNKYKVMIENDNTTKPEYEVILRLSEQYLNRAEANAQQGNIVQAIADLDVVRRRAGLLPVAQTNPSINQADLLNAIYHERQVELFAEMGNRWFDLIRTNRANSVLSVVKGSNWQTSDQLFPIPESELLADPNLTQNEGY